MVLGSGIEGAGGAILLYHSPDLRQWHYLHPACTGIASETGTVWECPNLFPISDAPDAKWILITSPIPMGRAIYFVGTFKDHRFTPEVCGEMDEGGCLYAPLLFRDQTGRRILFGWLTENRPGRRWKRRQ